MMAVKTMVKPKHINDWESKLDGIEFQEFARDAGIQVIKEPMLHFDIYKDMKRGETVYEYAAMNAKVLGERGELRLAELAQRSLAPNDNCERLFKALVAAGLGQMPMCESDAMFA